MVTHIILFFYLGLLERAFANNSPENFDAANLSYAFHFYLFLISRVLCD